MSVSLVTLLGVNVSFVTCHERRNTLAKSVSSLLSFTGVLANRLTNKINKRVP